MVTYRIFRDNGNIMSLQFEMESVFSYIKKLDSMSILGRIPQYSVDQITGNDKVTKEIYRFSTNLHIFEDKKSYFQITKEFEKLSSMYEIDIAVLSSVVKYSELIDWTCFLLFDNVFSEEIFVGQLGVVNNKNKYKILGKWLNDLHIIKEGMLNRKMLEESCSAIVGIEIEHLMYEEHRSLLSTRRVLNNLAFIRTMERFQETELIRIALRKVKGIDIVEKHMNEYIVGWR